VWAKQRSQWGQGVWSCGASLAAGWARAHFGKHCFRCSASSMTQLGSHARASCYVISCSRRRGRTRGHVPAALEQHQLRHRVLSFLVTINNRSAPGDRQPAQAGGQEGGVQKRLAGGSIGGGSDCGAAKQPTPAPATRRWAYITLSSATPSSQASSKVCGPRGKPCRRRCCSCRPAVCFDRLQEACKRYLEAARSAALTARTAPTRRALKSHSTSH